MGVKDGLVMAPVDFHLKKIMKDKFIVSKKTGNVIYTETKSVISTPEKRLMAMIAGQPPQNDSEKRLKKDVEILQHSGHIIEIPSM